MRLKIGLAVSTLLAVSGFVAGAEASSGKIFTLAGTGVADYAGDGGLATGAKLNFPIRAVDNFDGIILIADEGNNVIRKIKRDGTIVTVAGVGGAGGFSGDGGPAISARLNQPTGVAALYFGGFLIADRSNNRIRRVLPNGVIVTLAGSGLACSDPAGVCGDGGPATSALLNGPDRVVVLADGSYLITEDQGHKVRVVSATGIISTAAGTGIACAPATAACGDGGLATAAKLNAPNSIALLPAGGFVFTDSGDNRVRAVSPAGLISTLAGNGIAGSFGDGIAATSANLNAPSSVAVAPDGSIVIADTFSHLVRYVKGGIIRTLAGVADSPCSSPISACGDGGLATAARFNTPYDVAVREDGKVMVADHLDHRIRLIDSSLGGNPALRIQGARLVNGVSLPLQLRGVNRAIFESRCTYDAAGDADGPATAASIAAVKAWGSTTVRVSVNEGCWLGINGLPLSGNVNAYRAAVVAYINSLRAQGLYVIIENHVTAPGAHRATLIDYMPDADHTPAFWTSMAATFRTDHGVIFDIINEAAMASWNDPLPVPTGQWACWRNGCTLDSMYGGRFTAAGVQSLVNAIRAQRATQPIILGGLSYNADQSQLLANLPNDPEKQLLVSAHIYDFVQSSAAVDANFAGIYRTIAAGLPLILGELGERNCNSGSAAYTKHVLSLVDGEQAAGRIYGVLGWTWNAHTALSTGWHCPTGPSGDGGPLLILDYTGAPTVLGAALRTWLQSKVGLP